MAVAVEPRTVTRPDVAEPAPKPSEILRHMPPEQVGRLELREIGADGVERQCGIGYLLLQKPEVLWHTTRLGAHVFFGLASDDAYRDLMVKLYGGTWEMWQDFAVYWDFHTQAESIAWLEERGF